MCGVLDRRPDFSKGELATLRSLRRGAFAKSAIRAGARISLADIFFAIPTAEGQATANDMSKYTEFYTRDPVEANKPLLLAGMDRKELREKIYSIVKQVGKLLHKSGIVIMPEVDLEISHHYGIDRFSEFGLTMMTIVNREYCKKLIVLLPGQRHPEQYHKIKEETFHVLYGNLWVDLDGVNRRCKAGEIVIVERGVRHSFGTDDGVVIEEISSTHHGDDSFYTDPKIMENGYRKTLLTHWMDAH
jgi:quercetin dioxygenase-like cupin family protein